MYRPRSSTGWLAVLGAACLGLACASEGPDAADAAASNTAAVADGSGAEQASVEAGSPAGSIGAADLAGRLGTDDEPVILDVRSPEEYSAGHIPGAINVPFDVIGANLDSLDAFRDREIVVYCRSGRRAGIAEEALAEAGFTQLRDLEGHMRSWQAGDYPVVVPASDCC